MDSIRAHFRITRPLYSSALDRTQVELRPSAIIGALRFWWRALEWCDCGGSIARLKEREERIFGSTKRQAEVLLDLQMMNGEPTKQDTPPFRPNAPLAYLGYGLHPQDTNKRGMQRAALTDAEFTISLQFKPSGRDGSPRKLALDQQERDGVAAAVKALGLLGGIGGRSRKGWGSLTLVSLTTASSDQNHEWAAPRTRLDFQHEVARLMSRSNDVVERPPFSAFWRECAVAVGEPVRSPTDAHHKVLEARYKDAVLEFEGNSPSREDFGLPRTTKNPRRKNASRRRASPLWLHVHQASSEAPALPVATLLVSDFLASEREAPGRYEGPKNFLSYLEEADHG